jgi:glucose-1-phosphate adenylyltransferase
VVERDASVEDSIAFDNAIMEPGAELRWAIIDEEIRICAGASIDFDLETDRERGYAVSDSGIAVVPKGMDVIHV